MQRAWLYYRWSRSQTALQRIAFQYFSMLLMESVETFQPLFSGAGSVDFPLTKRPISTRICKDDLLEASTSYRTSTNQSVYRVLLTHTLLNASLTFNSVWICVGHFMQIRRSPRDCMDLVMFNQVTSKNSPIKQRFI